MEKIMGINVDVSVNVNTKYTTKKNNKSMVFIVSQLFGYLIY